MASIVLASLKIGLEKEREYIINFSSEDASGILPYNNDYMVITLQYDDWDVKRVLIDLGSSASVLF